MWEPIDTLPEHCDALLFCPRNNELKYNIGSFQWVSEITDELVSESRNASGRRKIYQERTERRREWSGDVWGAEYWMPLPDPPNV